MTGYEPTIEGGAVPLPQSRIESPIRMQLRFSDADPVADCLVPGCGWHGHGDSMRDATDAWVGHVAADHRLDWGDDE